MNKTFVFHLIKYLNKTKRIEISAHDSIRARELVAENFPDWQVSMFWVKWPF